MTRGSFCILASAVALSGCLHQLRAGPQPAVAQWSFDGDLRDQSGHGNDAYGDAPRFAPGHRGQGLQPDSVPVLVSDCADLRLAPGLRVECRLKFTTLQPFTTVILAKEGEYMLRVDPAGEGGHFSWFLHLDGWEPRVRSGTVPTAGVWYHLIAGWDGEEAWLSVDGDEVRGARLGRPIPTADPLRVGPLNGIIDELRIENPGGQLSAAASWSFEGNLKDASGNGHDITAEKAHFVPGRVGLALDSGPEQLVLPSHPDLHLAPGLRIDCSVYFDALPTGIQTIVIKDNEYQLRVNPPEEGGQLALFVNLDGWEPRVSSVKRVKAGVWYRVIAGWDGQEITLEVNGDKERRARSGVPQPTDNPVMIGIPSGRVDELRIENPQLPTLRVQDVLQTHAILQAGRPETLTVVIQNLGTEAVDAVARLELPETVTCSGSSSRELGTLEMGGTRSVAWTVQADADVSAAASIHLTAGNSTPVAARRVLAFVPPGGQPALLLPPDMPQGDTAPPPAVTYFVDSVAGSNANAGTSTDTPWRDFTHVNGKILGPGEKLLIKRGSVINQELSVSACGTPERWAEIGAYGTGARPIIRRNWDIDDRCVLVRNPDYLHIRSLVVSYAAKGLVVHYRNGGHNGLVIEDCIAHHIEGLYRPNSHGIPEWRDRNGAGGDGLGSSAGFAVVGAGAANVLIRDCEMFQTSWGFFVKGDAVTIDRAFCHDNYTYNTSPHPALIAVKRSFLQNSIFDAPGYHASAGTMGIMLCDPRGLTIRNCTFRNQPDSGSHDEGGIDFENHGNGCLIDHCTFENNAGAAIEVLGLKAPQPKNLEIMNSRFIRNNTARKLGPSEIYIWGRAPDPEVCCSTGTIHNNGYVTNPGIEFFVNEAPKTTTWTLRDNTRYASVEELEKAMPFNRPPVVDAGEDLCTDATTVRLAGRVSDDGRPGTSPVAVRWEVLEGPSSMTCQTEGAADTMARFSVPGDYLLRLVADDGELWLSDMVAVHILPPGVSVIKAWEFNTPLDKEGWSEVNPGTKIQAWTDQRWPCRSHPVKYVAGGYYILAIEESADAHLLSPDNLGTDLERSRAIRVRFQNHTPATRMRIRFTTERDGAWDDVKSRSFDVVAADTVPRDYVVELSAVRGWTGRLKQFRIDLATGAALTGTCRFDYVWIAGSK